MIINETQRAKEGKWGKDGKKLRGVEGGKIVVTIYYLRKNIFNGEQNKNHIL